MNITEDYPGQNVLISYLKKEDKPSYYRFLNSHHNIIMASITTTTNSKELNNLWISRFLYIGKKHPDLNDKITQITKEFSRYTKKIQIIWQDIIKKFEEDNTITPVDIIKKFEEENLASVITPVQLCYQKKIKENTHLTNFCYNILHELKNKFNVKPFYRCSKKSNNNDIRNPMDLLTICSKLDNDEYTNINEFRKDMHLIFHNCYMYNDMDSEIYHLGEKLESAFIKIWAEKTQKEELKKMQDNTNIDSSTKILTEKNINQQKVVQDDLVDLSFDYMAKQFQILEQNKDDLVFRNVVSDAFCATLAYKNLVTGNIIPFIKNLKTSLLSRSQMSLFSADEPVLQAIVEGLLPRKYRIPELTLVMDGKKQKGSGRFGYSDIFVIKSTGDNNVSLELKYVSLVGLIKKPKNEYGANDLEDLDKTLEKEDEEFLLSRPYSFWSKEHNKIKQIIISEMLENGINQLRSYMNVIAKGKTTDYSSSGIIDKRVKITKSNPNKLKGFVILVIGFRRVLWRPVEEVISNYSYYKA
ncbi:hypothetical protein GLOIN_2v1781474 [Rhizophagus clarus]|uniref:Bromo domain-containing protein n=1 Tax=Rhizophagus clarus TaxID=94130 RepID=A0A8H3M7K4_9GLOM|nr:hypothetical protein GLOIN_2v1781474 [Rhizophagus clarus]